MTKDQAWMMVANLCSQLKLNLEEHKQVQSALELLKPEQKPKE